MKRRLREEKGSMAVYVSVVLLTMIIILSAIFFTSNAVRRSELQTAINLKQSYEADNSRAAEIYAYLTGTSTGGGNEETYVQNGLILHYDAINNTGNGHDNTVTTWKDLSGSGNDGIITGATWNSTYLAFDGVDDIVSTTNNLNFNSSQAVTVEFVFVNNNFDGLKILFELAENSNDADCGFYIDTGEYGTNDLTFAMKYEINEYRNHKMVDGILDSTVASYSMQFDSTKTYDNFISIYKNSQNYTVKNVTDENVTTDADLSGRTLINHKMYIGGRQGGTNCANMNLMAVRVYNRALTQTEIQQNYEIDKEKYNLP